MTRAQIEVDEKKAIEYYQHYGSMNRAALSLGISPLTLKKILIANDIEIIKPKPKKWRFRGDDPGHIRREI